MLTIIFYLLLVTVMFKFFYFKN